MNVPFHVAEEDSSSAANQMSRWLDRVLGSDYRRYRPGGNWMPSINLYEDATAYFVVADLAGVDPDSIGLRMEKNVLILQGRRPSPRPPGAAESRPTDPGPLRVHLMEIDHGPFQRALELSESADADRMEACYRNGFLWVKIPKKAGSK